MHIDNALSQQYIIDNIHWRLCRAINYDDISESIKLINSVSEDISTKVADQVNPNLPLIKEASVDYITGVYITSDNLHLTPWATTVINNCRVIIYKYKIAVIIFSDKKHITINTNSKPHFK